MAKLNRREQTIINYMKNGGNMKQAMIDAGYSETYADKNSRYLLGIIGEEIKAEQEQIKDKEIKSVKDIQKWWSQVMDDAEQDMSYKVKCSENLVRSQGGFIDKLNGNLNVTAKLEDLL